ncbi:MAG TPA: GNAT family N-acetyltransferase [Candidatus Binataceae bacterium]|nr:GNAT family N-acetyltransferase [Candidatus Binataceae bacterium]
MLSDDPSARMSGGDIFYRDATAEDADAVAALHADSWRRHYRGAYLDSFLDGDVVTDRLKVWRERLAQPANDRITVVATLGDGLAGFVHVVLNENPTWGALLDNLHVTFQLKHTGIGGKLMREAARRLLQRGGQKFYLWVLDQNVAAQKFYAKQDGIRVETCLRGPFPGGGRALGHRIAWADARTLLSRK